MLKTNIDVRWKTFFDVLIINTIKLCNYNAAAHSHRDPKSVFATV